MTFTATVSVTNISPSVHLLPSGLLQFTALIRVARSPVFQPLSPASRKEAARETESPVFDYRLIQIDRMTAFDYLYILILIMIHCFGFQM